MTQLIKMTKDGAEIEVSPLTVENHKQLGWKVVGEDITETDAEEQTGEAAKKPRNRRSHGKPQEKEPTGE